MQNILHGLAYDKAEDILRTRKFGESANFWKDYVGLAPEIAHKIASRPDQEQQSLFSSLSELMGQQGRNLAQNPMNLMGQQVAQPQATQSPMDLIGQQQGQMNPLQQPQFPSFQNPKKTITPQVQVPKVNKLSAQVEFPVSATKNPSLKDESEIEKAKSIETKAKLKAEKPLTSAQQTAVNRAEKPYIDKISGQYEAANDGDKRLGRMEKLVKEGSLPNATFYNLFKNLEEHTNPVYAAGAGGAIGGLVGGPVGAAIGGTIGGLVGPVSTLIRGVHKQFAPDTEEFEKLSADFVKNAKAIFGSRLTDADLRSFLQTVPTLSQTDAGKLKVIKNMRSFNEASKVKYKAMREIIKENGDKVPANLELLVNDRVEEQLNEIARKFSE